MEGNRDLRKLTILHSNDMHGDFMAEQVDNDLVGGVSQLSGYVRKVRSEEENVLYVIAGDMFRGSIIDQEYRGMSTIEIMNLLSPDMVTIGNHEADYGIGHLLFIEKCARFPIINANLHIKTNGARLFKPCQVLNVNGINILFIGIITEEVLAQAKTEEIIGSFIDTAEAAKEVEKICNAHKSIDIDLTVLLTHIGYEEDKKLAKMIPPDCGVDIIIGGHSHTFLEEATVVNNTLIVQAGTSTDQIGRFDLVIDMDNNCVDSYTWKPIAINSDNCPVDEDLKALIYKFKNETDKKYARVLCNFDRQLTHPARNMETELGNLFADIFKESLGIDIMFMGSGSLRKTELGPIVDVGAMQEFFPYDDAVHCVKITGKMLKDAWLYILRDEMFEGHTEFYQVNKEVNMKYLKDEKRFEYFRYDGVDVRDDDLYTIGLQSFHFNSMKDFLNLDFEEVSKLAKPRTIATSCFDIIEEYFIDHNRTTSKVEGRITIV